MNTTIKRNGSYWEFYENGQLEFYSHVTSNYFTTFYYRKITLFNSKKEIICWSESKLFRTFMTIHLKQPTTSYVYKIEFPNIILKPYITLSIEDILYKIIIHKTPHYTILKNNNQIGYISETRFYIGNKEEFNFVFNSSENKILLYGLIASTICNYKNNNEILNFNHSNTISELQSFDQDWSPIE